MFRDAFKAVTRRNEEEPPPLPRRKSGETDKGFGMVAKAMLRRAVADSYEVATAWLSDTVDWLRLWEDNAEAENLNSFDNDSENADTKFPTLNP